MRYAAEIRFSRGEIFPSRPKQLFLQLQFDLSSSGERNESAVDVKNFSSGVADFTTQKD